MLTDEPGLSATIALCSASRVEHLLAQLAAIDSEVLTVVVWLDADPPPALPCDRLVHVPPGRDGLRLAAGRNAGAAEALRGNARLLIFLDADCVPGERCLRLYRAAARAVGDAILCGPVTYLPEGFGLYTPAALDAATHPHPARPAPPIGELQVESAEYRLFWSLSFAMTASAWRATGGFDEQFEGYGGEDTDFAYAARAQELPLVWVGGADAYHQYHPTSSPPWQHLDDILRNGAIFERKWNEWPMTGWLDAFQTAGAITFDGRTWRRS